MAGHFFARAARSSKGFNSAKVISGARYANSSRSKATTSFQRKACSTPRNHRISLLALSSQSAFQSKFTNKVGFPPPSGGLLNAVRACGLHTTSIVAVADGETSDTCSRGAGGVSVSEATESDTTIDPLSINFPPGIEENVPIEDIFASGMLDAPLTSVGLGGYTPIGMIQHCLDFLHLGIGLPWWGAVIAGTVIFRALVFPIMIKGQVNSAKLTAIKPELERLQEKLREVSNYQNPMVKAQASIELQQLFQKHDCHPVKALISPLIQLPLFISFFLALRQMSYLPVESMKVGGMLWFTDLTAADPYFILPVVCAATMLLTIETGAETGMANPQMKNMKNVFRFMCLAMVPLTYTFPTAIFLYWMTSNGLSLVQVTVMKLPGVKEYLGIPPPIITQVDPTVKTGTFMENLIAGFKTAQETAEVQHAEKMKKKEIERSLKTTYQETFEYNPRVKENEELFKEARK